MSMTGEPGPMGGKLTMGSAYGGGADLSLVTCHYLRYDRLLGSQ